MERRTRVVPTRLKDHVIPTSDPYTHLSDKVILPRHVADRAVTDVKMDWLTQVGSKADGIYWVYPTAYSAAPDGAACTPADSFDQAVYPIYLTNLTAGSCIAHGSPGGYLYITVTGKVT